MSPGSRTPDRHREPALVLIGLVGGVASGKSLVAEQLRSLGAELLDGDRAGHEVLKQAEVREAIRGRWGEAVFSPAGEVDRAALARQVFDPSTAGREALKNLEQITHPRIRTLLERQLADMRTRGVRARCGWPGP